MTPDVILQLAVAFGLGLLLGLERERKEDPIAGIRTFPLIALFGTVCAQLSRPLGGWIVAVGLVALSAVLILANLAKNKTGEPDPGITTEIAALLLFAVGALLVVVNITTGVVLAGVMVIVLHMKEPLHRFAGAVGQKDMHAIMQFVLLTLVILPILPNANLGPYGVWNPFKLWLMVVLIVGISLGGYVAYKIFGSRAGTLLGGIIGGLISSTATTVSFAKRGAQPHLAGLATVVILTASCVSLGRVLVEIAVMAPARFLPIAAPVAILALVSCAVTAVFYLRNSQADERMPAQKNPAELKSALVFGALYALVLIAVAFSKEQLGDAGLYAVALISGLTDMDAITLSTSQLAARGEVDPGTASRAILIAALANLLFKFLIVSSVRSQRLTRSVATAFALIAAAGAALLVFWD